MAPYLRAGIWEARSRKLLKCHSKAPDGDPMLPSDSRKAGGRALDNGERRHPPERRMTRAAQAEDPADLSQLAIILEAFLRSRLEQTQAGPEPRPLPFQMEQIPY